MHTHMHRADIQSHFSGKLFQLGTTSSVHLLWMFRFFQRCTLSLVKGQSTGTFQMKEYLFAMFRVCSSTTASHSILSFTLSYALSCTETHNTFIEWAHLSDLIFSQKWPPVPFSPVLGLPTLNSSRYHLDNFSYRRLWILAVMINMLHHWTSQGTGNLLHVGRMVIRIPFTKL